MFENAAEELAELEEELEDEIDDYEDEEAFLSFLPFSRLLIPPPPAARGIQDRTALTPRTKRKAVRSLRRVDALVLHQMAFHRGNKLSRYDRVTGHFVILRDGKTAQLHPASAKLWASHRFNNRSVAVEFAGNLPDTRGRCWSPRTNGCHKLTKDQVRAGRNLVRHLIRTLGIKYVFAHRQSAGANRANDPGPDIWFCVGQWAVNNLSLSSGGPGFKVGRGWPIPNSWRTWGRCP